MRVFQLILLLSIYVITITECTVTVDFSESSVNVEENNDVIFTCSGITLQIGNQSFNSVFNLTINHTTRVTASDNNLAATCRKNNELSFTLLNVLFEPKLENNTTHEVIIGREESVIVNLEGNPITGNNLSILKNGADISNFYIQKISGIEGRIILHFLQAASSDLGRYVIVTKSGKQYDVFITEDFSNATNTVEAEEAADIRDAIIIVSPAVSFGICLIVIIVAIWLVKRKRNSQGKDKEKKESKNTYVTTGEGIPAQPPTSRVDMPRPRLISSTELPTNNSNPVSPGPPLTQRSTSLHPRKGNHNVQQRLPVAQYQMHNIKPAISTDSLDSFDNAEDEYENFAEGGMVMMNHQSFSQRMHSSSSMQQSNFNPMMQQRPHAATSPKPMVAPKPKKTFYQNQIFLRTHGIMGTIQDDDDEELVYEGMN